MNQINSSTKKAIGRHNIIYFPHPELLIN